MILEEILQDTAAAVKDIMKTLNIDVYKYEIEGQSESGDNYMGEIIFLTVTPGKEKKTFHLVMKTAKRSKELREKLPIELFYNRELFMYSNVFPAYQKFIKEVAPDFKFDFTPKLYYTNQTYKKETLVIENLKTEGFKMWNRKKPWNLQHSLYTMKHYGKLHALSMALRDQRPDIFSELKQNLGSLAHAWDDLESYNKYFREHFENIMGLLEKKGRGDLVKKYDGILEEAQKCLFSDTVEDDKVAICHMDCWSNNFMFKYENEDESKPSAIRFLDFQLSVLDSPAKDLSYNIYATSDNACFNNFDLLLETYHDSLKNSLKQLGCDPSKFFSMADLRKHWRKYGLYGLLFSITLIKMQLVDKNDAPKIEEMAKCENMMDGFNVKITDQTEYDRRITEVFIHFGDNFL